MRGLTRTLVVAMALGLGAPPASSQEIFFPQLILETAAIPGTSVADLAERFGHAVAMDGNLLVIGAPLDAGEPSGSSGEVFVYERPALGDPWTLIQTLALPPGVSFRDFGSLVDVQGDFLIAGTDCTDTDIPGDLKLIRVYERKGGLFQFVQEVPEQLPAEDRDVCGAALGDDGSSLVVMTRPFQGALGNATVKVWERLPPPFEGFVETSGSLIPELVADPGIRPEDTVVIDGDTALVSANGNWCNRVFAFKHDGSSWGFQNTLDLAPQAGSDFRCHSVALSGDRAVVGGYNNGNFQGRAFVFERTGNLWTQTQELLPSTPQPGYPFFATGVALEGGFAAVGAPGNDSRAQNGGGVYLFERSPGGAWNEIAAPVSPALAAGTGPDDLYGWAVAIHQGVIAAAGPGVEYGPARAHGVAIFEEDLSRDTEVDRGLRAYLFPSAAMDPQFPQNQADAAFRFQEVLFQSEVDPADSQTKIRAQLENMSTLYGPAQIDRSIAVENKLREALAISPDSVLYQNLLLDILYHRTAAAQILAGNGVTVADKLRLDLPAPPPFGEAVIDQEILALEESLLLYRLALQGAIPGRESPAPGGYVDFLQEPEGPAIFQGRVPTRGLEAALSGDGFPVTDCNDDGERDDSDLACRELFSGYKDLVLLMGILRDAGRTAAELARLYTLRGFPNDMARAEELIGDVQVQLLTQGNVYLGFFPALPPPTDESALAEAIAAWETSMGELATVRELRLGGRNALGFEDDFLMFIAQRSPDDPFDSFDIFEEILLPSPGNPGSPLQRAKVAFDDARTRYDGFRGFEDQLATQFQNLTQLAGPVARRLILIVGAAPGEAAYTTPELNVGSEIWQQLQSIQRARGKILLNRQEIANLESKIQIEIERRGTERGINAAIRSVVAKYGDKQAQLSAKIGEAKAVQAASNESAEMFNNVLSAEKLGAGILSAVVGAVNAGVQAGAEVTQGVLQAQKEKAAAEQDVEIRSLEDGLLDANSRAQIKTWLLDMTTLAIESEDAALLMRQAVGQLKSLLDEKKTLEDAIEESSESLTHRFFADPAHRLRFQFDEARANLNFAAAQKWIYFMVRAWEYKWNEPFDYDDPVSSKRFTRDSAFELRNARELQDMYFAIGDLDDQKQPPVGNKRDTLSLREDVLGFPDVDRFPFLEDGVTPNPDFGEPILYEDPDGGAPLRAIPRFRKELRALEQIEGQDRSVSINFSTARTFPLLSLFDSDTWNDKIVWMVVQVPLSQAPLFRPGDDFFRNGKISYGGTSFIRNELPGFIPDPERPDRLKDELTTYSTRFWGVFSGSQEFQSRERAPAANIQVALRWPGGGRSAPGSCASPGGDNELIENYRERSVAATDWQVVLDTVEGGAQAINLDTVEDIELHICHRALDRP